MEKAWFVRVNVGVTTNGDCVVVLPSGFVIATAGQDARLISWPHRRRRRRHCSRVSQHAWHAGKLPGVQVAADGLPAVRAVFGAEHLTQGAVYKEKRARKASGRGLGGEIGARRA